MSAASSLPYRLRPNKSVDRELFLSLLTWLTPILSLDTYHYVGLGGPFLEDFRLVHSRLGLDRMTCIETEEPVHRRQLFNRPVQSITCICSTLEEYLDEQDFDTPVILWFDYTEPRSIIDQIERFARTIGTVPIGSILRITMNANPASLGSPDPKEISVKLDNLTSDRELGQTTQEWRLSRFRERLGSLFPSKLGPEDMTYKTYGKSILMALRLATDKEALNHRHRKVVWALATHYADGQPMVTASLIVCAADDDTIENYVQRWSFRTGTDAPHRIDLPALSSLERLTMESSLDPKSSLGFDLPKSDMGEDPFEVFRTFYRIFPHFSRVEL